MRLQPGAPDVVASLDGATVVMAAPGRLATFGPDGSARATATIPDGEPDVGFVGQRLIAVIRADDRTHLVALSLPELELMAQLELEGRLQLVATVGMRALIANESLEQPRIVTVTTVLVVEPIALHQPLVFATPAPEDRLLVAARGREPSIECWDPAQRRALFRLNLPLMPNARFAGFAHRRRLLWIAAAGEDSYLELYRFSDGRLQARAEMGGAVLGAVGHPDSPRIVAAVKPRQGPLELCALDFAAGDRHELTPPFLPHAFCVAECASPALVLHDGSMGEPRFIPLARALPPEADHPAPPVLSRATRTAPEVATLARTATATTTPATESARPLRVPLRAPKEDAPPATENPDVAVALAGNGTWRDRVCAWSLGIIEDSRRKLALPDVDDASPLADAIERLELDAMATRGLALLYGARLEGVADVPAATFARAISDGAPPDERAWAEALGRGALATLRQTRDGRVRLSALVARFLDGVAPFTRLMPPGDGTLDPPPGVSLHEAGDATLSAVATALRARYAGPLALLTLTAEDDEHDARVMPLELARIEARLHDAWLLVDVHDRGLRDERLVELARQPSVIVVRGAIPPSLASLPRV